MFAVGVPPCPSEGVSLREIHQLKTLILKGIPLEDPELRRLVRSAPGLDHLVIYPAERNSWISSTTNYEASREFECTMRRSSCMALYAMCKRERPIKTLSLILSRNLDDGWAWSLQQYTQPLKDRGTQLRVERRLVTDFILGKCASSICMQMHTVLNYVVDASREVSIPDYVEQCALDCPV